MQDLELLTAGQIAEGLDKPLYRVTYIIRKYRLNLVERIGIVTLFSEAADRGNQESSAGIQLGRVK